MPEQPAFTPSPTVSEVTQLLLDLSSGNRAVLDELFAMVYDELRTLAQHHLRREAHATLSSTALVHEAYLKLVDASTLNWQSRSHFYAIASQAMRRLLVSRARSRLAQKRGSGGYHYSVEEDLPHVEAHALSDEAMTPENLLALDAALDRLARLSERQSRLVECHFFGGLTLAETADVLGVSEPTVKRDWRIARAWLYRELALEG